MSQSRLDCNVSAAGYLRSRALEFIRSQDQEGLWPPQTGAIANAMTTAEVLSAVGMNLYGDAAELRASFSRLRNLQREDGSWTDPNDPDPWDCSATAWSIWALRGEPSSYRECKRGLDFLQDQIRTDGGIPTNAIAKTGNTYASAYAWRCFMSNGYTGAADTVFQFLANIQNADGGWGLTEGAASEPTLTMYVLDGILPISRWTSVVDRAVAWLKMIRGADGTFGSWLETGPSVEGTAFGLYVLAKANVHCPSSEQGALRFLSSKLTSDVGFAINNVPQIWIAVSIYLASGAI
jgi:hypothetical protein